VPCCIRARIAGYGQLIVDECHHLSAASFELVARRSKARYVLGLSATVARKDGHHPIIFMQCGPVRHRVDPKSQAAQRGFEHRVRLRETSFRLPPGMDADRLSIPALYTALAQDEARNALICDDVLTALAAGRCPLVLTERRDHLETLQARFKGFTRNLVVLRGGRPGTERWAMSCGNPPTNFTPTRGGSQVRVEMVLLRTMSVVGAIFTTQITFPRDHGRVAAPRDEPLHLNE